MTDSLQVFDKMRVSASTNPNYDPDVDSRSLVLEGSSDLLWAGSCDESGAFPQPLVLEEPTDFSWAGVWMLLTGPNLSAQKRGRQGFLIAECSASSVGVYHRP